MHNTEVRAINHTVHETHEWLTDLAQRGPFGTEQQAYSHLRAVLHSVRDRLTVSEAVHLAAELPMLVRGFYYEGWQPNLAPNEERTQGEFLDSVQESLRGAVPDGSPPLENTTRAVLSFLSDRLEPGQIRHARGQMPEEIRQLWPVRDDR